MTEDLEGVEGVDFVHTDIWVSMGEPDSVWKERIELLTPYRVTAEIMATSETDLLSGVLNRRGFERQFEEALARGRADGVEFVAKDFMDQHPLWKWMDGYLEDRPTQPWTLFD